MEEKKSSGEWVEKTKWKAMERKAAAANKVSDVVDSDDDNDEGKTILKVFFLKFKIFRNEKTEANSTAPAKKEKDSEGEQQAPSG